MNCFMKSRKTFETLCVCPVLDYRLVPWSIYDEVSELTISIEKESRFEQGDIVFAGDYMGIIKEIEREKIVAHLKCDHIVKLFEREIVFTEGPTGAVEQFIKTQIDQNYTNQADALYRLPYLNVIAESSTPTTMFPDVENSVWNIKSYIAKTRRVLGVFTTYEVSRTQLTVRIKSRFDPVKNLDLSDPSVMLLEESYSNKAVGKITSISEEDGTVQDWYLLNDGTITNTYMESGRVAGDWVSLQYRDADNLQYDIQNEFYRNQYSHKIRFSVPIQKARFAFYDKLKIAHGKHLFLSYIAAIRTNKNSARVEYQCGELRTTFTDKLQEDI